MQIRAPAGQVPSGRNEFAQAPAGPPLAGVVRHALRATSAPRCTSNSLMSRAAAVRSPEPLAPKVRIPTSRAIPKVAASRARIAMLTRSSIMVNPRSLNR